MHMTGMAKFWRKSQWPLSKWAITLIDSRADCYTLIKLGGKLAADTLFTRYDKKIEP